MATRPFDYGFGADTGAGLTAIPNRYNFADNQARDTYFSTHLQDLKQLETLCIAGDKVYVWTGSSNPTSYTASRWNRFSTPIKGEKGDKGADGAGVDLTGLKTNEVPVYDPVTNKLIGSGVSANLGELTVAPGTILFGNHRMSSSNENVVFTNEDTDKNYTPVWQEQKVGSKEAYMRIISDTLEEVVRIPVGTADVTNPEIKQVTVDADETFFGGKFILSQPATDVVMEAFDQNGHAIWEEQLGDLNAGEHEVTFQIPLDVRAGFQYDVKLYARGGNKTLVAKGPNAGTGLPFSWTAKRATWTDATVAKTSDLEKFVNDIEIANGKLIVTQEDGTITQTTLPTSGSGGNSPVVEDDVANNELPLWDISRQVFDKSGLVKTGNGFIVPPEGFILGGVRFAADPEGVSINPLTALGTYKTLVQEVKPGSTDAFLRSYGVMQEKTLQSSTSSFMNNPTGIININTPVAVHSMTVNVNKPIKTLVVELKDSQGLPLWKDVFEDIDSGEQEVVFNNVFNPIPNTDYQFSFTGESKDGDDNVVLRGNGTRPFLKLKMIPFTLQKIATQNYVGDFSSVLDTKIGQNSQDIVAVKNSVTALSAKVGGGSGTEPVIHEIPQFYGGFSSSWPTTLSGLTPSVGSKVVVTNSLGTPARVFILVPLTHASSVTGIKQGSGIAAVWTSGDVTIDGKQYKAFYSPRALHEQTATFTVEFAKEKMYV